MASDVSEYIEAPPTGSHDPGGLPQGAMTQERVTPNTSVMQMDGGKLVPQKRLGVVRVVRVDPGKKGVNSGLFLTS